jgi:hypothetical protein
MLSYMKLYPWHHPACFLTNPIVNPSRRLPNDIALQIAGYLFPNV